MSGTPELTVTVPCATCGGTGIAERIVPEPTLGNGSTFITVCWDCNGTGVTRTPVTCAGCLWAERQGDFGDLVCTEPDHNGEGVMSTFGCLDWTSREFADDNG